MQMASFGLPNKFYMYLFIFSFHAMCLTHLFLPNFKVQKCYFIFIYIIDFSAVEIDLVLVVYGINNNDSIYV
jgi:hypothetical protein